MFYRICWLLSWLPLHFIFPTKVVGKKNVKRKGKMILCANHQSNNDVVVIAHKFYRRFNFMAKSELFDNKLKGAILKSYGAYPVKRGQTDINAVKRTLSLLRDDKAICMFPEGTRVTNGEASEMKTGAIMFSLKTKSPIVPAVFINKPKAFKRNILVIGKPIELYNMPQFKDAKTDKETLEQGVRVLMEAMNNLRIEYKK